jgi:hypothetical protein
LEGRAKSGRLKFQFSQMKKIKIKQEIPKLFPFQRRKHQRKDYMIIDKDFFLKKKLKKNS